MLSTTNSDISSATPSKVALGMVSSSLLKFATITYAQLFLPLGVRRQPSDVRSEGWVALGWTRAIPRVESIPSLVISAGSTQTRRGRSCSLPASNLPSIICLHLGAILKFPVALTSQHRLPPVILRAETSWELLVHALSLPFPGLRAAAILTSGENRECLVRCRWDTVHAPHFVPAGSTIRLHSKSITEPKLAMKSVPTELAAQVGSVQIRNEC